jgi:hypothetical protein
MDIDVHHVINAHTQAILENLPSMTNTDFARLTIACAHQAGLPAPLTKKIAEMLISQVGELPGDMTHDELVELYESVKVVERPAINQQNVLRDCEIALGVVRAQTKSKVEALGRCTQAFKILKTQERPLASPAEGSAMAMPGFCVKCGIYVDTTGTECPHCHFDTVVGVPSSGEAPPQGPMIR